MIVVPGTRNIIALLCVTEHDTSWSTRHDASSLSCLLLLRSTCLEYNGNARLLFLNSTFLLWRRLTPSTAVLRIFYEVYIILVHIRVHVILLYTPYMFEEYEVQMIYR